MGWKQGRIPEIVSRSLPLAEVFLLIAQLRREQSAFCRASGISNYCALCQPCHYQLTA